MGISDEMRRNFGPDIFDRARNAEPYRNWIGLCVCGHLRRYHSPSVGGGYQLKEAEVTSVGGQPVEVTVAFFGCLGAMPGRGFEKETKTPDLEARTMVIRINPTCPCDTYHEVARVDRPNRYFNQKLPRDREDPARHPMVVGVRAFVTHLTRRKAATADPAWADAEFDRRFTWDEDVRICDLSKCKETTDVWPVYVDGERSELRCAAHR